MKWPSLAGALAVLVLGAPAAEGAAPVNVQLEVHFLLGYVEGSGCEFQRNGSWHDAPAAQAHLRGKYNALVLRDLVQTTEQFIERAASTSSFSGQPYLIRCNGGPVVTSTQWLGDELARLRSRR